jgi:hypothetical protein
VLLMNTIILPFYPLQTTSMTAHPGLKGY